MRHWSRAKALASALIWGLALSSLGTGCSFGPRALEGTHGRYDESIRQVYEEQLLRNIVHLRYTESPSALDIASIAAQFELSGYATAKPFFIAPNPSNSNVIFRTFTSILPEISATAGERPTLTFDPAFNGEAVRRFLTPIPQETLVFLAQTNWPTSALLRLWVDRMNGVPNGISGPGCGPWPDFVRFQQIAELVQAAQERDLIAVHVEEHVVEVGGPLPAEVITSAALVEAAKSGLEYRPLPDKKSWMLLRREQRLVMSVRPAAAGSPELTQLFGLLHLTPGLPRYELIVAYGVADPQRQPTPLAMNIRSELRSLSQVCFYLSQGVEVPPEHIKCGVAHLPVDSAGQVVDGPDMLRGLFTVHVARGHRPPECAYLAIKYRDYWFYIDDRDEASKATFMLMLQISRLDFAHTPHGAPVLTLPAGK